ncbi:hypothetical protein [Acerihabitans arboris]|uniref:Uncharacterized protein n=1 Tax=Acerihabitans arboris TaxID=2691583 RepID=A0A845SGM7_9GAMM|nr:hypothetical protein [Acerihabitans arboris]NDL64233.1 hypothetical protein [Acerihabitans arboris]
MDLTVTSVLSRLALEQDDKLNALLSLAAKESNKSGAPLAVRFKPGIREYVAHVSAKLGISSSEFINILIEGVIRQTLSPFQTRATQVLERFQLVMDAHGLSVTDVATLLSPWNIGLSVLESRERTLDYLTTEILTAISAWFSVSLGWLRGEATHQIVTPCSITDWHELAFALRDKIAENAAGYTPEIMLYRGDLTPPVDMFSTDTWVGVILIYYRVINGFTLRVAQCFGEQSIAEIHQHPFLDFMTFCGYLFKNGTAHIRTQAIGSGVFNLLSYGKTLPIMAVDKINSEPTALNWQTEEIQPILLPEKYATEEWLSQIKNNFE